MRPKHSYIIVLDEQAENDSDDEKINGVRKMSGFLKQ